MKLLAFLALLNVTYESCGTEPRQQWHVEDGTCPPTPNNSRPLGCFVVRGQVLDSNDAPMPFVVVSGVDYDNTDGAKTGFSFGESKLDGTFSLRFVRNETWAPSTPASQDSGSIWMRAAVKPGPGQWVSTIRDSILVRVSVRPVGSIPDTTTVTLRPKGPQ
jgi:hypothetical protein